MSFLLKNINIFGNVMTRIQLIAIIISFLIAILSFIDLLLLYNNKSYIEWSYTVGSISFFLPLIIGILQWRTSRGIVMQCPDSVMEISRRQAWAEQNN